MNIFDLATKKQKSEKLTMVTCYDYTSALLAEKSNVDCILVGDSLAMVMTGAPSTIPATIDMMEYHTTAVARAIRNKWIVADMPFLAHKKSLSETMHAIDKLMKAGAHSVKIEGGDADTVATIQHIVTAGVPVVAHLGLTPQSIHQLGGYKVQGKEETARKKILEQSRALQTAGVCMLVLECVPSALAKQITQELTIPTIGIGAGADTDGQVLVWQDLLGMNENFQPKFVRKYLNGGEQIVSALNHYVSDVKSKEFPSTSESYG